MNVPFAYPLYVRLAYEFSLELVRDARGLGEFERPDIEEAPYIGWDSQGRRFVLQWDETLRSPIPVLQAERDIEGFRAAARKHIEYWIVRRVPKYLADPRDLELVVAGLR